MVKQHLERFLCITEIILKLQWDATVILFYRSLLLEEGFQFTHDNTYLIYSVPAEDTNDRSDDDDDDDNDCDNDDYSYDDHNENGINGSGLTANFVNDFNSSTEDWNDD